MDEFTDGGVYIPTKKIALGFSFEGIVNDGAAECGLTTYNALEALVPGSGIDGRVIEPAEFGDFRESPEIKGFLRLRPLVKKAHHYFSVIEALRSNPEAAERVIANPLDVEAFDILINDFKQIEHLKKDSERAIHDNEFYAERGRMKESDYASWVNTQNPIEGSLNELRLLRSTMQTEDDEIIRGFVPYFATSKDEDSTFDLCLNYVRVQRMVEEDVSETGSIQCIISKDRIVGRETVPSRNDADKLAKIAELEELPYEQVWRVNDMYVPDEQQALYDAGFEHIILVPGYTFPHDYKKAEDDGRILVIRNTEGMAQAIGEYAKAVGF